MAEQPTTLTPEALAEIRNALREELLAELRPKAPAGGGPEDNQMLREARIGPAVRDYIAPELADKFPDLVAGAGRPDFIPDRKWLEKKKRSTISKFHEEWGLDANPDQPLPVRRKPVPYLNPMTGEREIPKPGPQKLESGETITIPPPRPPKKPKVAKKGRPRKKAANGNTEVNLHAGGAEGHS